MRSYLKHLIHLSSEIDKFIDQHKNKNKTLFLDGTGMLSSYQNSILSILDKKGLDLFDEIHLVSGSTYALFIHLAFQEGAFLWNSKDIDLWNANVRKWHNITPIVGLFKFMTYQYTKIPAGSFGGHQKACEQFFSPSFLKKKLSDFSEKYFIWTYSHNKKNLVLLNKNTGFQNLRVSEVISMASSVPSIFGSHRHNEDIFIDAMYAPGFSQFKYEIFKNRNVLHLNMFKDGFKDQIQSLKIHEHPDGNSLIQRDFYRFLLGIKNHEFELVTRYALFGEIP